MPVTPTLNFRFASKLNETLVQSFTRFRMYFSGEHVVAFIEDQLSTYVIKKGLDLQRQLFYMI